MGNATLLTQSCYNFTDRWKKRIQRYEEKHKKLFQCVTRNNLKFVYETQAIQRNLIREPEISSSEQERKVNALASGADEGRD